MSQITAEQSEKHDEHDGHHDPTLAHHFESHEQQFASGKLGMWVFLATEILMFSGLFCAYAVYRANRPLVFEIGHHYLDSTLGAVNTVVLLLSSFTMAVAVRAAQLGQKNLLVAMLICTLLGACGFMGIKYVEYSSKISHHLAPGRWYDPSKYAGHGEDHGAEHATHEQAEDHGQAHAGGDGEASHDTLAAEQSHDGPAPEALSAGPAVEGELHSQLQLAPAAPSGLGDGGERASVLHVAELPEQQRLDIAFTFFSVYYAMTGLHGIHVLVGMGVITWILIRSIRNEFGPKYFMPVDLVGLYWHLVDLVWIFLFPMLYLIH